MDQICSNTRDGNPVNNATLKFKFGEEQDKKGAGCYNERRSIVEHPTSRIESEYKEKT